MQVGSGVRTYYGMDTLPGNGRVALLFLGARLADETPSSSRVDDNKLTSTSVNRLHLL